MHMQMQRRNWQAIVMEAGSSEYDVPGRDEGGSSWLLGFQLGDQTWTVRGGTVVAGKTTHLLCVLQFQYLWNMKVERREMDTDRGLLEIFAGAGRFVDWL